MKRQRFIGDLFTSKLVCLLFGVVMCGVASSTLIGVRDAYAERVVKEQSKRRPPIQEPKRPSPPPRKPPVRPEPPAGECSCLGQSDCRAEGYKCILENAGISNARTCKWEQGQCIMDQGELLPVECGEIDPKMFDSQQDRDAACEILVATVEVSRCFGDTPENCRPYKSSIKARCNHAKQIPGEDGFALVDDGCSNCKTEANCRKSGCTGIKIDSLNNCQETVEMVQKGCMWRNAPTNWPGIPRR